MMAITIKIGETIAPTVIPSVPDGQSVVIVGADIKNTPIGFQELK